MPFTSQSDWGAREAVPRWGICRRASDRRPPVAEISPGARSFEREPSPQCGVATIENAAKSDPNESCETSRATAPREALRRLSMRVMPDQAPAPTGSCIRHRRRAGRHRAGLHGWAGSEQLCAKRFPLLRYGNENSGGSEAEREWSGSGSRREALRYGKGGHDQLRSRRGQAATRPGASSCRACPALGAGRADGRPELHRAGEKPCAKRLPCCNDGNEISGRERRRSREREAGSTR